VTNTSSFTLQGHVTIDANGQARVEGGGRVQDGLSTTLLVAEKLPEPASCKDLDDDDIVGLTGAVIDFRAARSGELYTATILPTDGEADERGPHLATVTLTGGGRTLTELGTLVIQQLFR
jgi:hypothetical protein